MVNRKESIYDHVKEFIDDQSKLYRESYSDNVYDFIPKIVWAVDEGTYDLDIFEYSDYTSWFEETVRDDYEELDSFAYKDVMDIKDLLGTYIRHEYIPDMYVEDECEEDPDYFEEEGEEY